MVQGQWIPDGFRMVFSFEVFTVKCKGVEQASTTSPRPDMRLSIDATIKAFAIDERDFVVKAKVCAAALHRIRACERSPNTGTIDQILAAFTVPQLRYFLSRLREVEGTTTQEAEKSVVETADRRFLMRHPSFTPLVVHTFRRCDDDCFYELISLIADSLPGKPRSPVSFRPMPYEFGFSLGRVGIREALIATLDGCGINVAELARQAKIHPPALSEFRANSSDLRVKTVNRILQALPRDCYLYFIDIFHGALDLLEDAKQELEFSGQDEDSLELRYQAFRILLSTAVNHCSSSEFKNLFCLIADTRRTS